MFSILSMIAATTAGNGKANSAEAMMDDSVDDAAMMTLSKEITAITNGSTTSKKQKIDENVKEKEKMNPQ